MTAAGRLTAGQFALAWGVVLLVILGLDAVWLGLVARAFYQREMGPLMSESVRVAPALAFYLLYPFALVFLALREAPAGWQSALLRAAVLGLAAYGAYDLTNLSVVRSWPIGLSLVDWAWGGVAAVVAGAAGYAVTWGRRSPL